MMVKFSTNVMIAFVVLGSLLLVSVVDVVGQEFVNAEYVFLDPLPESFHTLSQSICGQLYCPEYYYRSIPSLYNHDGSVEYAVSLRSPDIKPCDSSVYMRCGTSTVLAWQRWKATTMLSFDSTEVWEDHALVLYSPDGEADSLGIRWKLLYMVRTEDGGQWYTVEHSKYMREEPSNAAIYGLINEWATEPRNFFSINGGKDESGTWTTEYRGIELELVGGDVREKTWEAVVGEKPTKFFPEK